MATPPNESKVSIGLGLMGLAAFAYHRPQAACAVGTFVLTYNALQLVGRMFD